MKSAFFASTGAIILLAVSVGTGANQAKDEVKIIVKLKKSKDDAKKPLDSDQRVSYQRSHQLGVQDVFGAGASSLTYTNNIVPASSTVQGSYQPQPQYFYYNNVNHIPQQPQPLYDSNTKLNPAMGNFKTIKTVKITNTITPVVTRTITYNRHSDHRLPTRSHLPSVPSHSSSAPELSSLTPSALFLTHADHASSFSNLKSPVYGPISFSQSPNIISNELNLQPLQYHVPRLPNRILPNQQPNIHSGASVPDIPTFFHKDSHASHSDENYSNVLRPSLSFQQTPFNFHLTPQNPGPHYVPSPSQYSQLNSQYYPITAASSNSHPHQFSGKKDPQDHRQPAMTFVQTYAAPSVTVTKYPI